jgi:hypothetical protein
MGCLNYRLFIILKIMKKPLKSLYSGKKELFDQFVFSFPGNLPVKKAYLMNIILKYLITMRFIILKAQNLLFFQTELVQKRNYKTCN